MPVLEWIGKEKVVNHADEVPFHVLERSYSYGAEDSHNKIIHGDNLVALKALLPEYEGRVKCIYIDPPYNTGNEGWVYNDRVNDPRIVKWLGEVVGKEGEDLSRHDKWLCMMYPRLQMLQRLLAEDGAIFISIDDNEQANLKLICDEIFGSSHFLAQIVWQKRTSPDARKRMSTGHEYILAYVKDIDNIERCIKLIDLDISDTSKYKNPDNDPKGPWVSVDFTAQGFRPNQMYKIETPSGSVITPPEGRCWKNLKEVFDQLNKEGRLWFGSDGNGVPRQKNYLSDKQGKTSWTWWNNEEVGHTQEATQELAVILQKKVFDYPKPERLVHRIIQMATDKDSIILDSFAGSGTTAHAVLNLNKADGGNRKFILVEMMDYAESITAERVKRVIDGYGEGKKKTEGTGGGFSFYEVGEPLLVEVGLNEAMEEEKIRAYIWYTETRTPYRKPTKGSPAFLGCAEGTAVYFHYEKDGTTTLDAAFLRTVKEKAERYVIYADICVLAPEMMEARNIVFRKIPRDIKRV